MLACLALTFILLGCQNTRVDLTNLETEGGFSQNGSPARIIDQEAWEKVEPTRGGVDFPALPLTIETPSVGLEFGLVSGSVVTHTIESGQSLTAIANLYEVSVYALQLANQIVDPNLLLIGQVLVVPDSADENNPVRLKAFPEIFKSMAIGRSAEDRPIYAYVIGDGEHDVAVIGGTHGGYEWNTVLLAYRLMTYFAVYEEVLPENLTLHIIPSLNVDGIMAVTGKEGLFATTDLSDDTLVGRLNGKGVDLNRNWDCDWATQGKWGDQDVSGGEEPFSEPESRAMRDYLLKNEIEVGVWLHSAAGLVIPSGCQNEDHEPSKRAAALYGEAAGYPVGGFTAYQISGDAGSWLSQQDIASITVELSDHKNLEFGRNLRGLLALFEEIDTLYRD